MDVFQQLGPIVASSTTIALVISGLVVWAVWSLLQFRSKTAQLLTALAKAKEALRKADDPLSFAERYEEINEQLEIDPILSRRWREFRESLVLPTRSGRPVQSTTRPAAWFDIDLLRAPPISLDLRYHAAMPNLLVGAGLLFTFFGLALALGSAGGVVADAVADRNLALRTLLDTASFKFLTSLTGMGLSLVYAISRKKLLHRAEAGIDAFLADLEKRIPLLTPAALAQEQIVILERQATHIESFSNDLAVSLGSAIDQTFNERLAEHVGPLTEAMKQLSDKMASRNEDAMQTMLDTFLKRLEGGTSDHMQGVAESLSGLSDRLEGLQSGLGDAAVRMADSADAMSARMGEGAEAALTRITDQIGGLADSLRGLADNTRQAGAEAGTAMADRIGAAAAGFESAAQTISETLANAAASMDRRMSEQASTSSERLSGQLEIMVAELRTLAETSRAAGSDAFNALAERVSTAAAGFEATSKQVAAALEKAASDTGGTFGRGAEEAVGRIAQATEAMRDEMRALIGELRTSVGEAGQELRRGGAESAEVMGRTLGGASETLATAMTDSARRISEAGDAAGAALTRGGADAQESLIRSGAAFGDKATDLAGRISTLAAGADMLAGRAVALGDAAGAATAPLQSTASDLRVAGENTRRATEALAPVAQNVGRVVEQLSGAIQRMEAAASSAGRLSDDLTGAANRFAGVDRSLAETLGALQNGLRGFSQEITRFVSETDSNLGKAATQLGSAVKALEETLEDYAPVNRRAS